MPAYPHPSDMLSNEGHGKPAVVLTIAGFDPTSGAGATADLQVFATMGLFGTACLTALTVQSTLGVARVQPVEAGILREMLQVLTRDMPPAGVKIGMLGTAAITRVVAEFVANLRFQTPVPIVIDPVLRSSSGALLLEEDAMRVLLEELLPQATCITPNQTELAMLVGRECLAPEEVCEAAEGLLRRCGGGSVIVTGGDAAEATDLILERGTRPVRLQGTHVATTSTHGTGCAFSSALLSRLVLGDDMAGAAKAAKLFVENSLREAPGLGCGRGPMKLSGLLYAK